MNTVIGCRTVLELHVGTTQSVEVILHLRRKDVKWFRSKENDDDNNNNNVIDRFHELINIIQTSVIPRMFSYEIEYYNNDAEKNKKRQQKEQVELGPGGVPILPTKNDDEEKQDGNNNNNNNNNKKKQQKQKSKTTKRFTKKQLAEMKKLREIEERIRRKSQKDIHYAIGNTIQITYKLEDISTTNKNNYSAPGVTLLFNDNNDKKSKKRKQPPFRALQKLSKRIIIWCYPIDLELPAEEGFVRPEAIPIASLFRTGSTK